METRLCWESCVFLQRQVLYGSVNVCVLQVFQIEESLPS